MLDFIELANYFKIYNKYVWIFGKNFVYLHKIVLYSKPIHPKSAHSMHLNPRKSVRSVSSVFYYPFIDFKGLRVMCEFRAPMGNYECVNVDVVEK